MNSPKYDNINQLEILTIIIIIKQITVQDALLQFDRERLIERGV